jgi:hypothetical protein
MLRRKTISEPTATLSTAMMAVSHNLSIHDDFATRMLTKLEAFSASQTAFLEQVHSLAEVVKDQSQVLNNESDPIVVVAKKSCQKLADYLKLIQLSLTDTTNDTEAIISPWKTLVSDINEAKSHQVKTLTSVKAVEEVKQKYFSNNKKSDKMSKETQSQLELAQSTLIMTEKEALRMHSKAINDSYLLCPKTFSSFYMSFNKLFGSGNQLSVDYEHYNSEFTRSIEELNMQRKSNNSRSTKRKFTTNS